VRGYICRPRSTKKISKKYSDGITC
jgi:hypothetical protein